MSRLYRFRFWRQTAPDTIRSADNVQSFSRDGKWLYFSSNRGGPFEMWRVATAGGEPEQVTHISGFVAFESLDGSEIYYTQAASALPSGSLRRRMVERCSSPGRIHRPAISC
jgi:hypothetical protein